MTDRAPELQMLTDAGRVRNLIPMEDVWSVSEPDSEGKVRAVVSLGGAVLLIEGRRIFSRRRSDD